MKQFFKLYSVNLFDNYIILNPISKIEINSIIINLITLLKKIKSNFLVSNLKTFINLFINIMSNNSFSIFL